MKYEIGDEVNFYQNKEVRTGTVSFIGSSFISVYPNTAEVSDAAGEPIREIEYVVEKGDII
jgi:hypothetical protein